MSLVERCLYPPNLCTEGQTAHIHSVSSLEVEISYVCRYDGLQVWLFKYKVYIVIVCIQIPISGDYVGECGNTYSYQ